jgi:polyhydroxyalkanoate synthesis regulator phasin
MLAQAEEASMDLDDLKKTLETTFGALTPVRAREIARGLLGEGSARDQVSKATSDLLEWSARGRDRMVEIARREVREQLHGMGLATRQEVEALRKRVRSLERQTSGAPTGRSAGGKTAKRTPARGASTRGASSRTVARAKGTSRADT